MLHTWLDSKVQGLHHAHVIQHKAKQAALHLPAAEHNTNTEAVLQRTLWGARRAGFVYAQPSSSLFTPPLQNAQQASNKAPHHCNLRAASHTNDTALPAPLLITTVAGKACSHQNICVANFTRWRNNGM